MANTYAWHIDQLYTRSETAQDGTVRDDAVVEIHWRRSATSDDGYTADFHGVNFVTSAQVAADDYIAFDSLTLEQVVGWVESTNIDDVLNIAEKLDYDIVQQRNPKVDRSLPWL